MPEEKTWRLEYSNDTGPPDDEVFREWWTVTDGHRAFKADAKDHAEWLCALLNNLPNKGA